MMEFEAYIDDDRYSVPSFYLITARCEARARTMAAELLAACEHHLGVELRRAGEWIYAVGSFAGTERAAEAPASRPTRVEPV